MRRQRHRHEWRVPLGAAVVVVAMATTVASAAAGPAPARGIAFALGAIGVPNDVATELAATSVDDGRGDTFRFAAEGSRPATLTEGWVDIVRSGAAEVTWDVAPELDCAAHDVGLFVCPAQGAQVRIDEPWAVLWFELAASLPTDLERLHANLGFPVLTPGGTPWEAVDAFPWDTFQGTDRWHQLVSSPGEPWLLQVDRWNGSEIVREDSAGFGLLAGEVVVLAVPTSEFSGTLMQPARATSGAPRVQFVAQSSLADWLFGTAVHIHDGTFGQNANDTSGVDSQPDTDTSTRRGPGGLATPGPAVQVGEGTTSSAPSTASSDGPTTAGSDGTSTESGTSTETGAGSGTTGRVSDGGGLPVVPLLITAALASGFGLATVTRKRKKCSCTMTVAIEGPTSFGICCMKPKVALKHVAGDDGFDRSRIHLDADVDGKHGWDLFDAMYQATITPNCDGPGSTVDVENARYKWDVKAGPDGFELTVTVTADVLCDGPVEHPQITAEATHTVSYTEAGCEVRVLERITPLTEISHIDVHIICGSYSEVFGFWPNGGSLVEFLSTGTPGQVNRWRSSSPRLTSDKTQTREIVDRIGDGYGASHKYKLKVYDFKPRDCKQCMTLREYYEKLANVPGTYTLVGRNCATTAYDGLVHAGLLAPNLEDPPLSPSDVGEHMRDMTGNPMGPTAPPTVIDNGSGR